MVELLKSRRALWFGAALLAITAVGTGWHFRVHKTDGIDQRAYQQIHIGMSRSRVYAVVDAPLGRCPSWTATTGFHLKEKKTAEVVSPPCQSAVWWGERYSITVVFDQNNRVAACFLFEVTNE